MADNTSDKKIDEEWKRRAREEARNLDKTSRPAGPSASDARAAGPASEHAADEAFESLPPFLRLVSQLVFQASIHLGAVEDPMTGQKAKNMDAARQTLDVLGMLKDKTRGNLSAEEEAYLDEVLYSLRMGYVRQKK